MQGGTKRAGNHVRRNQRTGTISNTRAAGLVRVDQGKLRAALVYLLIVGLLAVAYYVTAKWGLSLSPVSGFATFVWPPTGIALATLIVLGQKYWPGIFIGAFFANFTTGAAPLIAMGIAIGNTLEPVVGTYLLRRFKFQKNLERIKDVAMLVGYAAVGATLIAATVGTTSLLIGGKVTTETYGSTWIAWWVGDMLGALILTPFLLLLSTKPPFRSSKRYLIELSVLVVLFLTTAMLIFGSSQSHITELAGLPYLVFPFLIWATLRFQIRTITIMLLLLTGITIWDSKFGHGPFIAGSLQARLFASQLYMGVTGATFLVFSAVVSERKRAQKAAEDLNLQLQKSLNATTAELRQEQQIEKIRDEFVATASHELRTPITHIKAYAQVLEEDLEKTGNKKQAGLAANINRQANNLSRLVGDILDVSQTHTHSLKLQKTTFDLDGLISKIVKDFRVSHPGTTIRKSGSATDVFADQHRIEQVIINLLTNASKYSKPSSQIIISTAVRRNEVVVGVKDKGSGISTADISKIFRRFYRTADSDSRKRSVSGLGLGLYISQEIIQLHGGKISVDSKLGKGSTFIFTIPIHKT